MNNITYRINKYQMFHYTADYDTPGFHNVTGKIYCFEGTVFQGVLYFYKEGATIPPCDKTNTGKLRLRFPENQMSDIVETLRKEKPLYIRYDNTYKYGLLMTTQEPIGEEEL